MILFFVLSLFSWIARQPKTTVDVKPAEEISSVDESLQVPPINFSNTWYAYPNHEAFDQLLEKYVNDQGKVNYQGFKADLHKLDSYLLELKSNHPQSDWPRSQQLAYWINAYNAFTIKLILDNYPVGSITEIDGGKPWDKKWIKLGDQAYSLNQIENEIIRPQFNEPRIHFAVNCAARSCPPLANQAFDEDNLESLLDSQTKSFINNPAFNKLSSSSVSVSKIFEWYAADFNNLISFLNKYSKTTISPSAKISFQEYDWKLNNQ